MKTSLLFFSLIFFSLNNTFAQEEYIWDGAKLTTSGKNIIEGVEFFYTLTSCNDESYVLIKVINNNSVDVNISWIDAFFTQDRQWIYSENDKLKHLYIKSKQSLIGNCEDNNTLKVPISNYIDSTDFYQFKPSNLNINFINN